MAHWRIGHGSGIWDLGIVLKRQFPPLEPLLARTRTHAIDTVKDDLVLAEERRKRRGASGRAIEKSGSGPRWGGHSGPRAAKPEEERLEVGGREQASGNVE
jgi:hypothetical protein